jgi:hypothetical protein
MIQSAPVRHRHATFRALPILDLVVVECETGRAVRTAADRVMRLLQARARVRALRVRAEDHGGSRSGALRAAIDALVERDIGYGWPPYAVEGRRAGVLLLSDGNSRLGAQQRDELLATGGVCELLAARGWPVHTVDVGDGGAADNAGLLRDVACATGGRWFAAGTMNHLRHACAAAMQELGD